ncbi:hypothetical protein FIE12Z_10266 [Fusarium flagelliforme]|uniref:Uncharacterized protein n=1 Tax=Fusarium flagelliforme TaxID=2675880 RepID=A0A395ME17_9HYPO|nr:hypothetical protein FIE12Z_10266 [Fusarium flagelliforme]
MVSTKPTLSPAGCVKPWVQKFTNDPRESFFDQFVSSDDARYVEIQEHENNVRYTDVAIRSDDSSGGPDLSEFFQLPREDGLQKILRLMILPFNTENDNAPPLSWKGFREHLDLLHLQDSFIYTEKMETPPTWFEVPLQSWANGMQDILILGSVYMQILQLTIRSTGFVVKPDKWDSNLAKFSLSVVYSPTRRTTHIMAHMLHKTDVEYLLHRLQALKSIAWHPLLVPLILMEQRMERTVEDITLIRDSVYAIGKRIGTHKNYRDNKRHEELHHYAYGEKVWERRHEQDVDFEAAPGKLTSIISECAMIEAKCHINESLLDWLYGLNHRLPNVDAYGDLWKEPNTSIMMKLSTLKTWSGNNRSRSVYLAKRAEAQMQACQNLMSQRDNAMNLRQTEAAVRDSSDMRAIAWVTLAFLPATFVAYIFLQL